MISKKKLTLPLIHALKNTNPSQRRKILRLVRHHNKKSARVNEVIRFVKDNKGMEYSKEKMNEYKNKALDILNTFPESKSKVLFAKNLPCTLPAELSNCLLHLITSFPFLFFCLLPFFFPSTLQTFNIPLFQSLVHHSKSVIVSNRRL